jgi:hypothetical protein
VRIADPRAVLADGARSRAIADGVREIVAATLDRETGRRPLARVSQLVAEAGDRARTTAA